MNYLGEQYRDGKRGPIDYARAREWFEKAAAAGYPNAMFNIGWMYDQGEGVPQDYAQARQWFEKAAASGNAYAMLDLGIQYRDQLGDRARAREWFEKAAASGNEDVKQQAETYLNFKDMQNDHVDEPKKVGRKRRK